MYSKITIFDITIPTYGTICILGILLVSILGIVIVWRRKLSVLTFLKLEFVAGIAAIFGAKFWDMFVDTVWYKTGSVSLESFEDSGYSYYGGAFLAMLVVLVYSRVSDTDIEQYSNNLLFLIPLLHSIWKIGCFLGGCCFGIPYRGIGSVVFPEGINIMSGVSSFPVQLLESLLLLLLAVLFFINSKKQIFKYPVLEYVIIYSVMRFVVEFLRYNEYKYILSVAQYVSLLCFFGAMVLLIVEKNKHLREEHI